MRLKLFVLLLLIVAHAALGQDHPNEARGFSPEKAFHVGDFDTVNTFSGNLIVTLPIGATFPVQGDFAYGLNLVYNSKVWDSTSPYLGSAQVTPTRISNTGMGWRLSLGRLWTACSNSLPCDTTYPGVPAYEGPDGAAHDFYSTLHPGDPAPPTSVVGYTRDGSYLRLSTAAGGGWDVEEPGGIIRHFETDPNAAASNDTRLKTIRDRFGNKITLDYDNDGISWSILDDDGRTQRIQKKIITIPGSNQTIADPPPNLGNVIDYVEVVAPGGKRLRYVFDYDVRETARGCNLYASTDLPTIYIPYLTSISLYDATATSALLERYTFTNNVSTDASLVCTAALNVGTIASMTLPTGGAVSWTYGLYPTPDGACADSSKAHVVGVLTRALNDGVTNPVPVWTYSPALVDASGGPSTVFCSPGNTFHPQQKDLVVTVTSPAGDFTRNYFSVWGESAITVSANGTTQDDYGLPYVRSAAIDSSLPNGPTIKRYLSHTAHKADGTLLRSTYVTYERDVSQSSSKACNRRVAGSREIYADDGGNYKDTAASSFDGLGHYRSATVTGNLTTPAVSQTTFSNFNTASGEYSVSGGNLTTTFYGPPAGAWLLNLFTYRAISENGSSSRSEFSFDPVTGALSSTRKLVRGDGQQDPHDVMAFFCRDSHGNILSERYFGGDGSAITTPSCNAPPNYGAGEYEIDHDYSTYGPRIRTSYPALPKVNGTPTYFLDQTFDSSGTLVSSRDPAGLETTYVYDILGRLTSASPPGAKAPDAESGAAAPEYVYKLPGDTYNQTSITLPTLFVYLHSHTQTLTSTLLTSEKYEFDKLGKLIRQSHLGSDGFWSGSETAYDGLGRKKSVSELESTGAAAPTGPLVAALKTLYSYDTFGRPSSVTGADGSVTTYSYSGARQSKRTVQIATGPATITDSITTFVYDALGRLRQVTEPSGPSTSSAPVAANVDTNYGYDIGGRLSSVAMKGAEGFVQNRIFSYDNRGFLLWESHPESGMTSYTYDAQGHVLTKRQGAASTLFDLNYTYDAAGRLRFLNGRNPFYIDLSDPNHDTDPNPDRTQVFRPVKEFKYGDDNVTTVTPTDYSKGKLTAAIRYNYPAHGGISSGGSIANATIRVTEAYHYQDNAGRKTHRTTTIESTDWWSIPSPQWNVFKAIDQDISYTDLDQPLVIKYPMCTNCGLPPLQPERNIAPTYSQGQITSVPGLVSAISYWPNGMRNQLVHGNGIADTEKPDGQTVDEKTSLSRPASFGSGLYDACTAPVILVQPVGGKISGSTTSILMQVSAAGSGLSFQWFYVSDPSTGGGTAITGATGSTYTAAPTATTSYYVSIANACRTINSRVATVSYNECVNPTVSASLAVNADRSVSLMAFATGTEPFTYTWYRVSDNAVVGSGASLTLSPISVTTSYYVKVTNPCGGTGATSSQVQAVIPLPITSTGLVAALTGSGQITVTWPAVTGAGRYHVERRSGAGWVDLTQSVTYTSTTYTDSGLASNRTYAYRVWAAADASDNSKSAFSNVDVATTMTFTSITGGVTIVAVQHMTELLNAVNSVRAAAGWTAVSWSDIVGPDHPLPSPNLVVLSAHILAVRARINEALQALGAPISGYTDPDPTLKTIRAIHITEVQQRAQ